MQYRAIIFDIDGTAVPLAGMQATPRLQKVIRAAQKSAKLCAATGRGPENADVILKSMRLSSPCVVMGGAVIVDPKTGRLLWGKPLEKSSVDAMLKLLRHYSGEHFVGIDVLPNEPVVELRKFVADKHTAYVIYVIGLEHEDAQRLISDVSKIDGTVAHPTLSWSRGKTDVHITHRDATKEHGIKKLMELLGLRKEDVIGVGDSANDLPIFQAVGHRVAVGNGSEELKAQADEIAPPVDEDGLAQVIEKYFLR